MDGRMYDDCEEPGFYCILLTSSCNLSDWIKLVVNWFSSLFFLMERLIGSGWFQWIKQLCNWLRPCQHHPLRQVGGKTATRGLTGAPLAFPLFTPPLSTFNPKSCVSPAHTGASGLSWVILNGASVWPLCPTPNLFSFFLSDKQDNQSHSSIWSSAAHYAAMFWR